MSQTGPRRATEDDFPEIVELLDRVFNYGSGGMPAHIPNWFDESWPERYAVIERDGRVVSTIGCLPQTFVVSGGEVEWWGIGNVATDKYYRGNGHMTALIKFWLKNLRKKDVPLAELGGDTKRYNHFGWENAGRECTYTLTERAFPDRSVDDADVRRYRGTRADIDLLVEAHRTENHRVKRSREEYRSLFEQHGVETLLCTGDPGPAYLTFNQEAPSGRYSTSIHEQVVPEFGGTVNGLHALLAHLWRHYGVTRLGVPVHPTHRANSYLRRASTSWSLTSHRMVNVLDLAGALRGFTTQMTDAWEASSLSEEGTVTLDITDSSGPPVTVSHTATDVSVEEAPSEDPDVELDRLAMTQFLFGFPDVSSSIKSQQPFLSTVLPLDFYIWRIEGP